MSIMSFFFFERTTFHNLFPDRYKFCLTRTLPREDVPNFHNYKKIKFIKKKILNGSFIFQSYRNCFKYTRLFIFKSDLQFQRTNEFENFIS